MGFHIDSSVLPRIYDYNHAREMFNSITPIRGGDQSVRRIGRRSDATKWLRHEIRDGVDVFVAGLHHSNIVEYHPTHYELSMCGWNTQSTQLFIQAITGKGCYAVRLSEYVPRGFRADINADATYNGYAIRANGDYKFDYDNKPLQVMPVIKKYRVNRKRMNEVRKVAKPFYEYLDAMHNITPEHVDTNISYWDNEYRNPAMLIQSIEDKEQWWSMFEVLTWRTRNSKYDHTVGQMVYTRNVAGMKRIVDEYLKDNNSQVLDEVV
jgi:hypothetical protein